MASDFIDKRDALIEKARLDSTFREELLTDPESAVTKAGLQITKEAVEAIKKGAAQIRKEPQNIPFFVPVTGVFVTTQPPPPPPKLPAPKPPKG